MFSLFDLENICLIKFQQLKNPGTVEMFLIRDVHKLHVL